MRPELREPRSAHRLELFRRWAVRFCKSSWVIAVAGTLPLVGCKQLNQIGGKHEKQDLLEAELRTREREVLELRAENQQLKQLGELYGRHGMSSVITGPVLTSGFPVTSSNDAPIMHGLTLGTGTGGVDDDGMPGDESFQVVLAPKDDAGTAVKVPGRVTISAMEITKEGVKVPIGKWDIPAAQLKKTWKGGLFSSGYSIPLQWDIPPASDKVRVNVQFVTNDGRLFEADKDVNVRPLPGLMSSKPFPVIPPKSMPLGPPTEFVPTSPTVLPPPGNLLPAPEFPSDTPAKLMPAVPK